MHCQKGWDQNVALGPYTHALWISKVRAMKIDVGQAYERLAYDKTDQYLPTLSPLMRAGRARVIALAAQ